VDISELTPDWRFQVHLGAGKRGSVHRVSAVKTTGLAGILKVLGSKYLNDAEERIKFYREAQIFKTARHWGIPGILETNCEQYDNIGNPPLFFIREFIGGISLDQYLDAYTYEVDEAVLLVLKILEILSFLHNLIPPVVHRDLKPKNIIMRTQFAPVLIDFGSAFRNDGLGALFFKNENNIIGNAFVSLPGSEPNDETVDVAMCCGLLVYLLTRKFPGRITRTKLPHHREFGWSVHADTQDKEALLKVLDKGLASNQIERFQSVEQLREALMNFILNAKQRTDATALAFANLPGNTGAVETLQSLSLFNNLESKLRLTLTELAELCEFKNAEYLSPMDVLQAAHHRLSLITGQPLISAVQLSTFADLFRRCKGAPNSRIALESSIFIYPTLIGSIQKLVASEKFAIKSKEMSKSELQKLAAEEEIEIIKQSFQVELGLANVDEEVISSYQEFLDVINHELDGNLKSVKNIRHPFVWKFGVGIGFVHGKVGSYRLFRIPRGTNCPLIFDLPRKTFSNIQQLESDIAQAPVGSWSTNFAAEPVIEALSTSFLDSPREHAQEWLFEEFMAIYNEQGFSIGGSPFLCSEQVSAFVFEFFTALGYPSCPKKLDVRDILNRIESHFLNFLLPKAFEVGFGPRPRMVDDNIVRDWFYALEVSPIQSKRPIADELAAEILQTPNVALTIECCHQLLSLGINSIDRVYDLNGGQSPLSSADNAHAAAIEQNFLTVIMEEREQYLNFLKTNEFHDLAFKFEAKLRNTAMVYRTNFDDWIRQGRPGIIQILKVENNNGRLPSVTLEPLISSEKFERASHYLEHEIKGYSNCMRGLPGLIKNHFSFHPVRDLVYERLFKDMKKRYKTQQ
jgi:hypothetical protein